MAEPKTPAASAATSAVTSHIPHRRSRRWLAWVALGLVAAGLWFREPVMGYAQTGASYAAHVGCSCRHIGGRPLESCRDDFEPGMAVIMLSEDPQARSVTARFPLLSTQTATYREGQGCVLQAWKD